MRVLVTGAGGFVGSHVVRHLLEENHDVAAVVRHPDALARLEGVAERVTLFTGDLGEPDGWREQMAQWRPEACVHTAWYAEPGLYLPSPKNLDGLRFSLSLLETLAEAGCKKVAMAGTCFEYDTSTGYLKEDSPVMPLTLYAACKLALRYVAAQRAAQLGVSLAWGRIFYVYGPYEDRRRLVPALTLALLQGEKFAATTGEQVRDYMHVADVASGLAALALAGCDGVFNVCSSEPVTIARLMLMTGELAGNPELIRFGERPAAAFEPPFICGDNHRLREATGWEPRRSLHDGLRSTVEWWKARTPVRQ
jgi:nucleoside-diphosphate-sugar epimerase